MSCWLPSSDSKYRLVRPSSAGSSEWLSLESSLSWMSQSGVSHRVDRQQVDRCDSEGHDRRYNRPEGPGVEVGT
jgi:hypothetical protein